MTHTLSDEVETLKNRLDVVESTIAQLISGLERINVTLGEVTQSVTRSAQWFEEFADNVNTFIEKAGNQIVSLNKHVASLYDRLA